MVLAGAEHLIDGGTAELDFTVNLDRGAVRVGSDLPDSLKVNPIATSMSTKTIAMTDRPIKILVMMTRALRIFLALLRSIL